MNTIVINHRNFPVKWKCVGLDGVMGEIGERRCMVKEIDEMIGSMEPGETVMCRISWTKKGVTTVETAEEGTFLFERSNGETHRIRFEKLDVSDNPAVVGPYVVFWHYEPVGP